MEDAAAADRTAGEMTLFEHLRELRTRLFRAVIALALGAAIGYALFPYLLDVVIAPYCAVPSALRPDDACALIATKPLEPFSVRIKTALVIGLFLGGPVIFYQLWRFISPGLTSREKRYSLPFVLAAQLLFAAGIGFAYLIVPRALRVLLALGGPGIEPLLSATDYLTFFLALCIAFGLVFELPLVLISLVLLRVVGAEGLRRARPYAIVVMAVSAAFITPTTDAVTLLFVVGPAWVFYELSILVAWFTERRRRRRSGAKGQV